MGWAGAGGKMGNKAACHLRLDIRPFRPMGGREGCVAGSELPLLLWGEMIGCGLEPSGNIASYYYGIGTQHAGDREAERH